MTGSAERKNRLKGKVNREEKADTKITNENSF